MFSICFSWFFFFFLQLQEVLIVFCDNAFWFRIRRVRFNSNQLVVLAIMLQTFFKNQINEKESWQILEAFSVSLAGFYNSQVKNDHNYWSSETPMYQYFPSLLWLKVKSFSHVQLFATPWTVAHQAPLSMGFSRQEYWSGLPFPSPGALPNLGIEPRSPTLQAFTSAPPGKPSNFG